MTQPLRQSSADALGAPKLLGMLINFEGATTATCIDSSIHPAENNRTAMHTVPDKATRQSTESRAFYSFISLVKQHKLELLSAFGRSDAHHSYMLSCLHVPYHRKISYSQYCIAKCITRWGSRNSTRSNYSTTRRKFCTTRRNSSNIMLRRNFITIMPYCPIHPPFIYRPRNDQLTKYPSLNC